MGPGRGYLVALALALCACGNEFATSSSSSDASSELEPYPLSAEVGDRDARSPVVDAANDAGDELEHHRDAGELVDGGHCPAPNPGETESYGCPKGATCDGPELACYSCVTNAMQHQICKLN